MRIGHIFSIGASCALVGLGGCTTVPALSPINGTEAREDGSIPINEVVKRVKCEIYDATRDIPKEYAWFQTWGANVDLDLIANESSSITPSVAALDPFTPFRSATLGTFSRGFSLGLGGGVTTTASRTESVSFSMNFTELHEQLNPASRVHRRDAFDNCNLPKGRDLNSDLGLRQWIKSVLGPLEGGNRALLSPQPKQSTRPAAPPAFTCRQRAGVPSADCEAPLKSITHSIEFTVVKSANISPSWTLVHFKGHTGNGSMAGAGRTDTHRLKITLGPSNETRTNASTQQSLREIAPAISNAVGQSLNAR
ncbi:hypothetical protein KKP04_09470 [Rhodomicrobium sp. Az07]|uniref:hypothetical protein n=1 Tax=Rhodomicrobium sp. Az07 TaxID=2839034 RepID=UPI001BE6FF69|nr:hypothetical protein [Rhodomicrobium sp. Az07]MBT3071098.1 hypothetical protein [Rhodomicrobium sp. Az07]